jgi:hypothetical protein
MKPTSTRTAGIVEVLAAPGADRLLDARSELGRLPLGRAPLDVIEDEGDLAIEVRARRDRLVAAQRAPVDVDAACGQHERFEAALRACEGRVGVDADERIGGELVRGVDALAQRQGAVGGARQRDVDPVVAQVRRDEVREDQRQVLFAQARDRTLRTQVRATVTRVEHDERALRRCRRGCRRGDGRDRRCDRVGRHHGRDAKSRQDDERRTQPHSKTVACPVRRSQFLEQGLAAQHATVGSH